VSRLYYISVDPFKKKTIWMPRTNYVAPKLFVKPSRAIRRSGDWDEEAQYQDLKRRALDEHTQHLREMDEKECALRTDEMTLLHKQKY